MLCKSSSGLRESPSIDLEYRGSQRQTRSTAADEVDDLDGVPWHDRVCRMLRPRDDRAVNLDGNRTAEELQMLEQLADRHPIGDWALFSVQRYDHPRGS